MDDILSTCLHNVGTYFRAIQYLVEKKQSSYANDALTCNIQVDETIIPCIWEMKLNSFPQGFWKYGQTQPAKTKSQFRCCVCKQDSREVYMMTLQAANDLSNFLLEQVGHLIGLHL